MLFQEVEWSLVQCSMRKTVFKESLILRGTKKNGDIRETPSPPNFLVKRIKEQLMSRNNCTTLTPALRGQGQADL